MAGGLPSNERIAVALLVVAKGFGEHEVEGLAYCARVRDLQLGAIRSRWIVLAALDAAYPAVGRHRMGRWLGFSFRGELYAARMGRNRRAPWWSDGMVHIAMQLVAS